MPPCPSPRPLLAAVLLTAALVVGACGEAAPPSALARARAFNGSGGALLPAAVVDSLLAAEAGLPAGVRVGAWARRFAAADSIVYRFGPAAGGYVAEGRLVHDRAHDCVSLMYRCSELARAGSAEQAVALALATRFAGAPLDSLVDAAGRVDYDRPEHLDFSLDMIRSGHWGRDVTGALAGAVLDTVGSARYPAGAFRYLPTAAVAGADLREGDIAWLVLAPESASGGRLRREYGLVVGHIGIVILEDGVPRLVHAASSGLEGAYAGGTVVTVPLAVYLERVDKFCGAVITRLED